MELKRGLFFLVSAAMIFSACNKNHNAASEQSSASESSVPETSETAEIAETTKAPPATGFEFSVRNGEAEDGGELMSIDGVLYSADGKTLVYCPADRTGEFTVPSGVEVIGEKAFYQSALTSVLLPPTLTEIGDYAFNGSGLEKAELPDGLKTIGNSAFAYTNIEEIYIPDSVESCGKIFGYDKENRKISAPLSALDSEEMSDLLEYENVTYRGETDLSRLLRKTDKIVMVSSKSRIFIDLDGDNFPEMVYIDKYSTELKQFNIPAGRWESIFYIYPGTDFNLYYDREKDEYFYLYTEWGEVSSAYCVYKINVTEDGFVWDDEYLGEFVHHSNGYWDKSGNTYTYIAEEFIDFGYLNGRFFIGENDPDFENNTFREAMSEYEIVNSVNIQKIIDEYGDKGQTYEIVMSEFADSPEPSPYKKPVHEKTEEAGHITIGEENIPLDSQKVFLSGEEATEENFEKLSHLPRLTTLLISGRYGLKDEVDLTGIDKLSGLGELHVYGAEIKNAAEIGKLKNLKVLNISSDADDLTFLTAMDNLIVIQFDSTMEKPADFYKPIYGMKNLRYLLLDVWDPNMTAEQREHITENAPHISIMSYKWG